jgi:hypothetical protein
MTLPTPAPRPPTREVQIATLTGLRFCDRECGCGENSQLWWFPASPSACRSQCPSWVPGWMNGADTDEIWRWLVAAGKVAK